MNRIYSPLPQVKYRPLPESLTIGESKIEGLGLFAKTKIINNTVLGISHVKSENAEDGYVRTPLGGFINHSENPNCIKKENSTNLYLKTIRDIEVGEELTLKYTIYKI